MTDLVERVARAIAEAAGDEWEKCSTVTSSGGIMLKMKFISHGVVFFQPEVMARAAIAAMHEPTGACIDPDTGKPLFPKLAARNERFREALK